MYYLKFVRLEFYLGKFQSIWNVDFGFKIYVEIGLKIGKENRKKGQARRKASGLAQQQAHFGSSGHTRRYGDVTAAQCWN